MYGNELDTLTLDVNESGTSTADIARVAATWQALAKMAAERYRDVRNDTLGSSLRAVARSQGVKGVTLKVPGMGKVTLTAPDPTATVADHDAFAEWVDGFGDNDLVEWRWHVAVVDHDVAAHADNFDDLRSALRIEEVAYVSTGAIDALCNNGIVKVTDNAVVHVATGEVVPGTSVDTAAAQVRITVDRDVRDAVYARLRAALPAGDGDL